MKQDEIRLGLIDGTIYVIARDGLDKASTKQIGLATSINEAYIYRCFNDKEDMFAKAFASLDEELFEKAMQHVEVMYMREFEYQTRCRIFFNSIWRFLLGNRNKCLAYIRYYYSSYFSKYSAEEHKIRFVPLVEKFKDAFLDESNVWMILNHIHATLLDFALKVFDGFLSDSQNSEEHVFRLIYASIGQYFKKKESCKDEKSL